MLDLINVILTITNHIISTCNIDDQYIDNMILINSILTINEPNIANVRIVKEVLIVSKFIL